MFKEMTIKLAVVGDFVMFFELKDWELKSIKNDFQKRKWKSLCCGSSFSQVSKTASLYEAPLAGSNEKLARGPSPHMRQRGLIEQTRLE